MEGIYLKPCTIYSVCPCTKNVTHQVPHLLFLSRHEGEDLLDDPALLQHQLQVHRLSVGEEAIAQTIQWAVPVGSNKA